MGVLQQDITAFERMRGDLEAKHLKAWVVFYRGQFEGVFADFESAAESAVERFDRGPYLIRQVGAGPVHLGGGLVFKAEHADSPGGV